MYSANYVGIVKAAKVIDDWYAKASDEEKRIYDNLPARDRAILDGVGTVGDGIIAVKPALRGAAHAGLGILGGKLAGDGKSTWKDNVTSALGGTLAGELAAHIIPGASRIPAAWLSSVVGGAGLNALRKYIAG